LKVANRYPFTPDSGDASAAEFTGIFHPVTGQVARLLRGSLRDVVAVQGTRVTRRPDAAYTPSPKFLELLSKSVEIGQTFYANNASTPSFAFSVRGQPGPDVPRITLVLDDQPPIVWGAGPQTRDLSWSVTSGRRAELTGKYGTDQEMGSSGNGPWAVLRLFDRAKRPTAPDVFEWAIDATTPTTQGSGRAVRLQVARGQNVLSRGIFTGLRECAMIDR
jgi:type VI protein secretion system component VasK